MARGPRGPDAIGRMPDPQPGVLKVGLSRQE